MSRFTPEAVPNLPPAYRLAALDEVDSTNEEARRRAVAGAGSGTLIWARRQTRGRGRHGRTWVSPPGNLYCSLLLRPECPPAEAAKLGFVAALAVGEAVAGFLPERVRVGFKWPNDVLIEGRKVAGILLESASAGDAAVPWLVIGVGVNVASRPARTDYAATSLAAEGTQVEVPAVLAAYVRRLDAWLGLWRVQGFAPVREAWLARAERLGSPLEVRLPGEILTGTFAELDMSGALILATADGSRVKIAAGDVFFPRDLPAENRVE